MVEEHGAEMSSRDKKDARRVSAAFEFQGASPSSSGRRRRGGPDSAAAAVSGGGRERGQHDSHPQIASRPTPGSESLHNLLGAHLMTMHDANDSSSDPSRQQAHSPLPSMDPVTTEYVSFYPHFYPHSSAIKL